MNQENIEFTGPEDQCKYVVRAMKWLETKNLESKHTTIVNINAGNIKFDERAYTRDIYKICATKDGKALTDEDLDAMGSKTGQVLEMAVNQLNFLSASEIKNLQWRQA